MKKTILIIEDDPLFRKLLCTWLESDNYQIFEADDGVAGLELYAKNKPDLIITDIVMPEKEGIEVIQKIREDDPTIPIIAMSAGGSRHTESYLRYSAKFGANVTLEKPFKKKELLKAMNELLS